MFNQLSVNNISLGTLTDVISYALDLDVRAKQKLLGESERRPPRPGQLLAHLNASVRRGRALAAADGGFPPLVQRQLTVDGHGACLAAFYAQSAPRCTRTVRA